jgi:hypothetical protein
MDVAHSDAPLESAQQLDNNSHQHDAAHGADEAPDPSHNEHRHGHECLVEKQRVGGQNSQEVGVEAAADPDDRRADDKGDEPNQINPHRGGFRGDARNRRPYRDVWKK